MNVVAFEVNNPFNNFSVISVLNMNAELLSINPFE